MRRPPLLFLAPCAPAASGNGLAMRGWSFLEAYARSHDIHLIVLPVAGRAEIGIEVERICTRIDMLPLAGFFDPVMAVLARVLPPSELPRALAARRLPRICRYRPQAVWRVVEAALKDSQAEILHVQRLYMAPAVLPLLQRERADRPFVILDLDDDDARSFERIASLLDLRGEAEPARDHHLDSRRFAALARDAAAAADRALLCSEFDRARLSIDFPEARFAVVPNAPPEVTPGTAVVPGNATMKDIDLLFVATFNYFPNADGAEWLALEVMPLLPAGLRVCLVGNCPDRLRDLLAGMPGIVVAGRVPDLAPYYARARAAVVPLRAGGGTRIKILEAVAYGVPVVSTTIGAEGLDFADGRHLLLADTPEAFAEACMRTLDDGQAASRRAQAASLVLGMGGGREGVLERISDLVADARITDLAADGRLAPLPHSG